MKPEFSIELKTALKLISEHLIGDRADVALQIIDERLLNDTGNYTLQEELDTFMSTFKVIQVYREVLRAITP